MFLLLFLLVWSYLKGTLNVGMDKILGGDETGQADVPSRFATRKEVILLMAEILHQLIGSFSHYL